MSHTFCSPRAVLYCFVCVLYSCFGDLKPNPVCFVLVVHVLTPFQHWIMSIRLYKRESNNLSVELLLTFYLFEHVLNICNNQNNKVFVCFSSYKHKIYNLIICQVPACNLESVIVCICLLKVIFQKPPNKIP